jgi:hypothetical protein
VYERAVMFHDSYGQRNQVPEGAFCRDQLPHAGLLAAVALVQRRLDALLQAAPAEKDAQTA